MRLPLILDPRERSVLRAVQRFCPDEIHARYVADLTVQLFDALASQHKLPATDRQLAWSAAMLHDIGHHIAGKSHHKHGQYLLKHIRMPGFTAPELAVLANVVRYHSRSRPKPHHTDYAALSREDRRRVDVLAGIVRVADALDRSHDQPVVGLDVHRTRREVRLDATMREGGELEQWAFMQRHDVLSKALGRTLSLRILRPDGTVAHQGDQDAA